jgi:CheY-like chemotaxis protein
MTAALKQSILVVDDDSGLCRMLAGVLNVSGYQTFPVYNGEDAVLSFKANKPNLVLLDFAMPVMNGYGVLQEIRRYEAENTLPRTPIIFLTAYPSAHIAPLDPRVTADDYLQKPVLPSAVALYVKGFLARWRQGR